MKYLNKIHSPADLKKLDTASLRPLCAEIRKFLIRSVSRTGGHLASNLGVVELSVALHYCFDAPTDKIVWDVGHQAYVHKILTGRRKQFDTLRMFGGLSGFPKCSESEYDVYDVGHSSTSISVGLGLCAGRDLLGEKYNVVSIIGDGAISSGLAFEGLNNAGRANSNMTVILNDNQMSISENVGAISKYLNEIRTASLYLGAKEEVHNILGKMPLVGESLDKLIEKVKDGVRYTLVPGALFEELGFTYVGPVDGHNLKELIAVLRKVKKMRGPVLLHVRTTKGKGYEEAEKAPTKFHGIDSFDVSTGKVLQTKIWDTYSDVFGKTVCTLAEENEKLVAITAAMPEGTGLAAFKGKFPKRFFDVGIAESHAVTFAGALAKSGFVPVVAIYSTFLQRAYDQIIHDVCLQNLHVIFALDRAGAVPGDGETHQGLYDVAFLTSIPNMTVLAPKNKFELIEMLKFATKHNGPVAIRYPRGAASRVLRDAESEIVLGKAETIAAGEKKIALVSLGAMMDKTFAVYEKLVAAGHNPTLINARFAKPIDTEMVASLADYEQVFVMEDDSMAGGFGSKVLEAASAMGITLPNFHRFAFPDGFLPQGETEELFKQYGLDEESMYERIISIGCAVQ